MTIEKELLGEHKGEEVFLYTLLNEITGFEVQICSYGCAITSVKLSIPTIENEVEQEGKKNDKMKRDVVCGYSDLESILQGKQNFGTIVGRCANRIKNGKFTIDGKSYQLNNNNGLNHLHGGTEGFYSKNFHIVEERITDDSISIRLFYQSKDQEEGYPGDVDVFFTLSIPNNGSTDSFVRMDFEACNATKPTLVSLTNHCYWNLLGHDSGCSVSSHELHLPYCSRYTAVDESLAITGELTDVSDSIYDFRENFKEFGKDPPFDLNYCIDTNDDISCSSSSKDPSTGLHIAANIRVKDLQMQVSTNAPGIQVYTGQGINPNNPQWQVSGKNAIRYQKYGAVCLETQNYPDAINNTSFGHDSILRPNEKYNHTAIYTFTYR